MDRSYYKTSTLKLAEKLLGDVLVVGNKAGRIVETEAYLFKGDPACHAAKGMTKRNASMFLPAGHSYVYLIYGMYFCFNVVSGKEGEGEAVLVRALEPLEGVDDMKRLRATDKERQLLSGPGKLCMGMGIDKSFDGKCLMGPEICIESGKRRRAEKVASGPRVGISDGVELPYRLWIDGSQWVSK